MEGSLDYTTQDYLKYSQCMVDKAKLLNEESDNGESGKWNAHRLELAIWSHYIAYDLNPELLSKMPGLDESNTPQKPSNGEVKSANGEENGNGVANGAVTDTDEDSRLSAEVSTKTTDDENAETSEPYSENPSENPSAEASPEPSPPQEETVNSVESVPELNNVEIAIGLNKVEPAEVTPEETTTGALEEVATVEPAETPNVQNTLTPVVENDYTTVEAVKRPYEDDDTLPANGVDGDSLEPDEKKCRLTSL